MEFVILSRGSRQQLECWGCVRDKVTVGMKFVVGETKTWGVDRDVGTE